MKNVTIKQLRTFVMIAQEHSFSSAAAKLHVSPSALTMGIQDLEGEIGVRLFDRTTRSVELTPQGANFLPVAMRMLDELAHGMDDLRAFSDLKKGTVVIISTPIAITAVLAPVIYGLATAHPDIAVRIIEDASERLPTRVLNGDGDFGITTLRQPIRDMEQQLLLRDRLGMLCPKDHPILTKLDSVTWSDLAKYRLASLGPETGIRAMLDNDPRIAKALPRPKYEVSSVASLLALVQSGVGIGVFPALVACTIHSTDFAFRPIIRPVLRRELYFLKRKRRTLTPAAEEVANRVFAQVRTLQEESNLSAFADFPSLRTK